MGKHQKGKGGKRPRAWHHGPLEDTKFDRAVERLDQAGAPHEHPGQPENTPTKEKETR